MSGLLHPRCLHKTVALDGLPVGFKSVCKLVLCVE